MGQQGRQSAWLRSFSAAGANSFVLRNNIVNSLQSWFGIRVKSCFEQVTSSILRAKGYEEYVPVVRSRRRWSDRFKEIEAPVFPGYVFCRFDPNRRLPILTTTGVVSVVGFGGVPAPIPDEEIQAVRVMLASALPLYPHPFLAVGQRVRIEHGPLAGAEGFVISVEKDFRLVASISLLQRSISVELDCEWVEAVSAPVAPGRSPHVTTQPQEPHRQSTSLAARI